MIAGEHEIECKLAPRLFAPSLAPVPWRQLSRQQSDDRERTGRERDALHAQTLTHAGTGKFSPQPHQALSNARPHHSTLSNAARIRSGFHGAGGVGAAPGRSMLVPCPACNTTCLRAAVTDTLPRSTNTPNTPLLGPAKKRVPRTAIRPNDDWIRMRAGALPAGRLNRIGP